MSTHNHQELPPEFYMDDLGGLVSSEVRQKTAEYARQYAQRAIAELKDEPVSYFMAIQRADGSTVYTQVPDKNGDIGDVMPLYATPQARPLRAGELRALAGAVLALNAGRLCPYGREVEYALH